MKSRVSEICEPESWVGGSLESQPEGDSYGESQTHGSGNQPRGR